MTPALEHPGDAIARLVDRLSPVATESVELAEAPGRVLAVPITTDRPSPACDQSAMDGYAVRRADLGVGRLPVAGEAAIGREPPPLPLGAALRIFTGGPVPPGADTVIPREDVAEHPTEIEVLAPLEVAAGQHVRHRGENLAEGIEVIAPGSAVDTGTASALATFGLVRPEVFRRVRVGVLVTGDEVLGPEADPTPYQLRDSNGSSLVALLAPLRWVEVRGVERVVDRPDALAAAVKRLLADSDALVMTGGVSMGDHDHVPATVAAAGGEVVFHRLAQRPGKPMLGAVGPEGQAILGLPGNPVSVMVTARRLGLVALRRLGGFADPDPAPPNVTIADPDEATIGLWWNRLVELVEPGVARLVPSRGSGDLVSAARADGFVSLPPGEAGSGPWPYYAWESV